MSGYSRFILNDGPHDKILNSNLLLYKNIKNIVNRGKTAKISDITKTHSIYVMKCFKPFVSIGFEYIKCSVDNNGLGNSLFFKIPQVGDFVHDAVIMHRIGKVRSKSIKLKKFINGYDWDRKTPANVKYLHLSPFGINITNEYYNLIQYCEFPGEKLHKRVEFRIDGNLIDEYYNDTVTILRQFLPKDKLEGYKKCMGQESSRKSKNPNIGIFRENRKRPFVDLQEDSEYFTNFDPAEWIEDISDIPGNLEDGIPWNYSMITNPQEDNDFEYFEINKPMEFEKSEDVFNGPQTPKYEQPELNLMIPLRFWFCENTNVSLPLNSIPYGQKIIKVELTSIVELCYISPGLYVHQINLETQENEIRPIFTRSEIFRPKLFAELYLNTIYIDPSIQQLFIDKSGYSLIRVFQHQKFETKNSIKFDLKWPIERIYFGFRIPYNKYNNNNWREWHRFTRSMDLLSEKIEIEQNIEEKFLLDYKKDTYHIDLPIVNNISVFAENDELFDAPQMFYRYRQYLRGKMGNEGLMMLNYAFDKGETPSGHLNLSLSKIGIEWETSEPILQILYVAIAINFLIYNKRTAALKFMV